MSGPVTDGDSDPDPSTRIVELGQQLKGDSVGEETFRELLSLLPRFVEQFREDEDRIRIGMEPDHRYLETARTIHSFMEKHNAETARSARVHICHLLRCFAAEDVGDVAEEVGPGEAQFCAELIRGLGHVAKDDDEDIVSILLDLVATCHNSSDRDIHQSVVSAAAGILTTIGDCATARATLDRLEEFRHTYLHDSVSETLRFESCIDILAGIAENRREPALAILIEALDEGETLRQFGAARALRQCLEPLESAVVSESGRPREEVHADLEKQMTEAIPALTLLLEAPSKTWEHKADPHKLLASAAAAEVLVWLNARQWRPAVVGVLAECLFQLIRNAEKFDHLMALEQRDARSWTFLIDASNDLVEYYVCKLIQSLGLPGTPSAIPLFLLAYAFTDERGDWKWDALRDTITQSLTTAAPALADRVQVLSNILALSPPGSSDAIWLWSRRIKEAPRSWTADEQSAARDALALCAEALVADDRFGFGEMVATAQHYSNLVGLLLHFLARVALEALVNKFDEARLCQLIDDRRDCPIDCCHEAVIGLLEIPHCGGRAVQRLIQVIEERNCHVGECAVSVQRAVKALGVLGPKARIAVPSLQALLEESRDEETKRMVRETLHSIASD